MRRTTRQLAFLAAVAIVGCEEPAPPSAPPPRPVRRQPTITAGDIARTVLLGRTWLASTQNENGSWNCDSCGLPDSAALTGLAVLAIAEADDAPFREAVQAGAQWLCQVQREDGSFPAERFEGNAIALWALARASRTEPELKKAAERAVAFLASVQPPHGGFDKKGATSDDTVDPAVTIWVTLALYEARAAGIEGAAAPLSLSAERLTRVQGKGTYLWVARLLGQTIVLHPPTSAVEDTAPGALSPGRPNVPLPRDLTFALFVAASAQMTGGAILTEYRRAVPALLCKAQETRRTDDDGQFVEGSWSPKAHRGGKPRERIALTALAVLCLTPEQWVAPLPPEPVW